MVNSNLPQKFEFPVVAVFHMPKYSVGIQFAP